MRPCAPAPLGAGEGLCAANGLYMQVGAVRMVTVIGHRAKRDRWCSAPRFRTPGGPLTPSARAVPWPDFIRAAGARRVPRCHGCAPGPVCAADGLTPHRGWARHDACGEQRPDSVPEQAVRQRGRHPYKRRAPVLLLAETDGHSQDQVTYAERATGPRDTPFTGRSLRRPEGVGRRRGRHRAPRHHEGCRLEQADPRGPRNCTTLSSGTVAHPRTPMRRVGPPARSSPCGTPAPALAGPVRPRRTTRPSR